MKDERVRVSVDKTGARTARSNPRRLIAKTEEEAVRLKNPPLIVNPDLTDSSYRSFITLVR